MPQPADRSRRLENRNEMAMIQRLRSEGSSSRGESSPVLQARIMAEVDGVRERYAVNETSLVASRAWRRAWPALGAATVAVSLMVGLGLLASFEAHRETATTRAEQGGGKIGHKLPMFGSVAEEKTDVQSADYVTSTTAVAVESWTTLQQSVNPLDELGHDAQLAGQMALSTLPLSAMEMD